MLLEDDLLPASDLIDYFMHALQVMQVPTG